jgi:hypothetical protein
MTEATDAGLDFAVFYRGGQNNDNQLYQLRHHAGGRTMEVVIGGELREASGSKQRIPEVEATATENVLVR